MSARAEQIPNDNSAVVIARAEHIQIEADPVAGAAPAVLRRRKVRASYALQSRLRGCATELEIHDDHYIAVRTVRPHAQPCKYEVDLRFASPRPVRVRSIAWFWLALAVSLAVLAAGGIWVSWDNAARWTSPIFLTALATAFAAAGAMILFLRRTVESLEFVSVHGGATLISVIGGIGSARAGKQFFVELIKSINAAKAERPQEQTQFLRDEMREHHRLRELGVISEEQYERSKARILASHPR